MRALVLAPHPDDEINVAGSTIIRLIRSGVEVFVAYSTNGDFNVPADIRADEAIGSLNILGVDRDHIIWLGYGDTFNGTGQPHVFCAQAPTRSPAGHVETYAPHGFEPWRRSSYTRENFFADLQSLIVELRADLIFCVDFDFHADHRALSIMFDRVMASILRRDQSYRPEVYKRFAYSTAFTAPQDLHSRNLLSTVRPALGLEAYDFDLIDKFNYVWSDRIRFPMPRDCREPSIDNPIARAVFAHRSQRIQWNALAVVNADEIFFERRTDSITFSARVTATSGDSSKACDFQMLDVEDINASPPTFADYFWTPTPDDPDRRLIFEWEAPQRVERIKIYGSLDGSIDKLRISLDNITSIDCRVERGGRPTVIDLPQPISILRAEFSIVDPIVEGGIGEIEMLPSKERADHVMPPFIKIIADDEFIYDYKIPSTIERIEIGICRFHFDGEINFFVDGGTITQRDGDRIEVKLNAAEIKVRAVGDGVSDEIMIRRVSPIYFWRLRFKQMLERIYIHWLRKKF